MTTIPTFGQFTTLIQSSLSKVKAPSALAPGSIPLDVEMSVQAMQHTPWYAATRAHPTPVPPNQPWENSCLRRHPSIKESPLPNLLKRRTAGHVSTAENLATGTQTANCTGRTFDMDLSRRRLQITPTNTPSLSRLHNKHLLPTPMADSARLISQKPQMELSSLTPA